MEEAAVRCSRAAGGLLTHAVNHVPEARDMPAGPASGMRRVVHSARRIRPAREQRREEEQVSVSSVAASDVLP